MQNPFLAHDVILQEEVKDIFMGQPSAQLIQFLQGKNPLTETDHDWLVETARWATDWASALRGKTEEAFMQQTRSFLARNPKFPIVDEFFDLMGHASLLAFALGRPDLASLRTIPGFWQDSRWGRVVGWTRIFETLYPHRSLGVFGKLFGPIVKVYTFEKAIRNAEEHTVTGQLSIMKTIKNPFKPHALWPRKLELYETGVVRALFQTEQTKGFPGMLFPSKEVWAAYNSIRWDRIIDFADSK